MREQKSGQVAGLDIRAAAMSAYGATKGADTSLMFSWAIELRGSGVRASCVSPLAATPMFDRLVGYHGTKRKMTGRQVDQ